MTPHNRAKKEDVAKVVLMPGDPLRAKWISETFLQDAKLINDVRGMFGFTGTYKGKKITVMAHGMGIPSIGIYSYELFKFYEVDTIIRIGSAGSYVKEINVGDVIIAKDASAYSTYAEDIGLDVKDHILAASEDLVELAVKTAQESHINASLCRAFSSDTFYSKYTLEESIKRSQGASVVEMEGFALYANAIKLQKKALMLLTCSDSFITKEELSIEERQTKFKDMVTLAFDIADKIIR
jgi:purine-nucleoside phosphorylase